MCRKPAAELFDRLSSDLVALKPDLRDQVLCPLCLRSFERSALALKTQDGLTLEHIIPRALGGKRVTLTCKECNNAHGSALDAHIVRMIRLRDWIEGDESQLAGNLRVEDLRLPMRIAWGAGKTPIVIRIPGGPPVALQDLMGRMDAMKEGSEIHLDFSLGYIATNADRALLRIGYLALFDALGYSYALSGAAACVRRLIAGGDADQLWRFLPHLKAVKERGAAPPVLISPVVLDHVTHVAYLLLIRVDAQRGSRRAVLLPASNVPEDSVMALIAEIAQQLGKRTHSIKIPVTD